MGNQAGEQKLDVTAVHRATELEAQVQCRRMITMNQDHAEGPIESWTCWLDDEMAEISLLLPGWQAAEIERRARSCGLTLGQLFRLVIRDYLTDRAAAGPVSNQPTRSQAMPRGDRFVSQGDSP
jgi:hypothetical protein